MNKTFIVAIFTFLWWSCQVETKHQLENINFLVGEWLEKVETDTINFRNLEGLIFNKDEKTQKIHQTVRHSLGFSEGYGEIEFKFIANDQVFVQSLMYQNEKDTFKYFEEKQELLRLKDQKIFIKKTIQEFFLSQISGTYIFENDPHLEHQIKIDKDGNFEHLYLGAPIYLEEDWSYTNIDLIVFKRGALPKSFGFLYTKEKLIFYHLDYDFCYDCIPAAYKGKEAFSLIRIE